MLYLGQNLNKTINAQLINQLSVSNVLGEGIQSHPNGEEIWWTDIQKNTLFRYQFESEELSKFPAPKSICSFAFVKSGNSLEPNLLVAFASGIAYFNPHTQDVRWVHADVKDMQNQRLNDGRVDRQGRFWVGSMSLHSEEYSSENGRGELLRFNAAEELTSHEKNIHISNGTCWSPDSKIMYFSDSPRNTIYSYSFDKDKGEISQRKIFHTTPKGAFPDGACVDAEGYLWSAHWGANKVVRYNPNGEIDYEVFVPASQVSCVCFAGKNLNLLCVTSARQDMSTETLEKEPQAGDVFIYQTNVQGLPESIYLKK